FFSALRSARDWALYPLSANAGAQAARLRIASKRIAEAFFIDTHSTESLDSTSPARLGVSRQGCPPLRQTQGRLLCFSWRRYLYTQFQMFLGIVYLHCVSTVYALHLERSQE